MWQLRSILRVVHAEEGSGSAYVCGGCGDTCGCWWLLWFGLWLNMFKLLNICRAKLADVEFDVAEDDDVDWPGASLVGIGICGFDFPKWENNFFDFGWDGGNGGGFVGQLIVFVALGATRSFGTFTIAVVLSTASKTPFNCTSCGTLIDGYGACCVRRMCLIGPFGCRISVKLLKFIRYGKLRADFWKSYIWTPFDQASSIIFCTSMLYRCQSDVIKLSHSHLTPLPAVVVGLYNLRRTLING